MNSVKLIFSIASMALLASCNSCKNSKQATATSTNTGATVNNPWLGETKWVFENYTKNPVAHLTTKPSLNFETVDEKTVSYSGKSFVNNYSGTLTVIKNVITKKYEGMSTQMASADDNLNKLEYSYFQNINKIAQYKIDGNKLMLICVNENNEVVEEMIFTKG